MGDAKRDRLDFLDVARGLAAVLVLVEHGLHLSVPGYLEFSKANIVVGQAAILVFFMISGFVIPTSLVHGQTTVTFWRRRVFRLFPVYWLSIALGFAYLAAGGSRPLEVEFRDTGAWLSNLVLLQGVVGKPHVWGVFWSLQYELALYAICSVLFATGLLGRIGAKTAFAFLAAFVMAGTARPLLTGTPPGNGDMRLVILASAMGYFVRLGIDGVISRRAYVGIVATSIAAVALVGAVHYTLFPGDVMARQIARSLTILGLAYATIFGLAALRDRPMPRFGVFLGRRSYPIYLLHPFVLLFLIPTGWPAWAFVPALFVATLALAEVTHRLVERPGIAMGRGFEKRKPAVEEPVTLRFPAPPEPLRRAA